MADREYDANIITLVDDDGRQHEFEVLDAIETDEGRYCALLPYFENDPAGSDESDYIILQVVEVDGGEELTEVEDREMYDALSKLFEERFAENYSDE